MVLEFIKDFEGFRPQAYNATPNEKQRNIWTIGYGFTNINGAPVKENDTITEEQASKLLQQEIEHLIKKHNLQNYPINKQTAIVSLIFNIGGGAWNRSTLKRKIEQKKTIILEKTSTEYIKVKNYFDFCGLEVPENITEFHRWCLQNGKILKGLLKRRIEESNIYLGDLC